MSAIRIRSLNRLSDRRPIRWPRLIRCRAVPSSFEQAARRVLDRADELATYTEEPGRITRPLATRAMAGARARVREWMQAAGLETRVDAIGNLAGRRDGATLLIGSHLDSGRRRRTLRRRARHPRRARGRRTRPTPPLEVVAFADEDGLRFKSRYLGSRAFVGEPRRERLAPARRAGRHAARGDRRRASARRSTTPRTRAYFEVHIEQGPVLEAEGPAARRRDRDRGPEPRAAGVHAAAPGTPARPRCTCARDAAAAAAEFVLAAERAALAEPGPGGDRRRVRDPARRGQRDPGPRRASRSTCATRRTRCARRRSRGCARRRTRSPRGAACRVELVRDATSARRAARPRSSSASRQAVARDRRRRCGGCRAAPGTTR